ncbi:MAG: hypothetical protein HRT36_08790, partial [Alphaproteobacteria bacterium]|nr:hypothetical protein [Alphaproteobacteria bacterium]
MKYGAVKVVVCAGSAYAPIGAIGTEIGLLSKIAFARKNKFQLSSLRSLQFVRNTVMLDAITFVRVVAELYLQFSIAISCAVVCLVAFGSAVERT